MKTAVKWMANELLHLDHEFDMKLIDKNEYQAKRKKIINQAKEMEKEQIKMCCIKTMETCNSDMNELGCKTMDDYFNYIYNETFK